MVALRIALRYLFAKKSHNAVNVISIVSTVGVAVATAAIVCVLSVFNGFTDLSMSRLSAVSPDIKVISAKGKVIAAADSLARVLSSVRGVESAWTLIDEQALAIYHNRQIPVRVIGASVKPDSTLALMPRVIDGEYMLADTMFTGINYAAVSVGVAIQLGARPGYYDWLALYAPRRIGRINPANPMDAFVSDSLCVSAVYEVEDNDFDASTVIVPIDVARNLLDYTGEASSISVTLDEGCDAAEVEKAVSAAAGSDMLVYDRLRQNEHSFRMIAVEKWITFAMLAFILVIASFNVVSTMSMLIIEKQENISTLRAMGATDGMVKRIFMLEGWFISLLGGAAGLLLGTVLVLAQQYGGFIKLSGDPSQMTITSYPVSLQPLDLLAVGLLVAFTGYLFGYLTSWLSTRR